MGGCILEVNPERQVWESKLFVYYFVDHDLVVEIFFEKEVATE